MDFRISDESLELARAVRDYLTETHGPDVLRAIDADPRADEGVWPGLVAMGLPGLLVPEGAGGLGRSLLDGALIAREAGRVALTGPLVDTALIAVPWLIARGETSDLGAIAAGTKTVALQHRCNAWVVDGAGAALKSVDPLRRLTVPEDAPIEDAKLLDLGALMSAAQLIGLAEAMLDQAVGYAKLREQFGQPIGAFQAVKHRLADVAVALEFARPVVWRAAQAVDDGLASASIHVSHAKYAATDAAYLAGETAIQVHGAMGYTYEVDLHFWMKRSWALSGAWGDRSFHFHRVANGVRGGALPIGPSHSFA